MSSKVIINITEEALTYLTDARVFEVKNEVIDEMVRSFGAMIEKMKQSPSVQKFSFAQGTDAEVGKISKGENYRQQPYVVCDFPRLFKKDDVFAYRVMLWWGHYFIFTFHLAGQSLKDYWPALSKNIKNLNPDYWVSNGEHEWEHAVEKKYFDRLKDVEREQLKSTCEQSGFLKIVHTLPLKDHGKVPETAQRFLHEVLAVL